MKIQKMLIIPLLALAFAFGYALIVQAATPAYVCSECGTTLTYESDDGDHFTITHPYGGTCSHNGTTSKTIPSWATYKNTSGTSDNASSDSSESTEEDYGIAGFMLDTVFAANDTESDSLLGDLANPLQTLADGAETVDSTMEEFAQKPFYFALQAIAITLTLYYFMTGLITRDLSQNFGKPTLEMITRPFGKLIVVIAFIMCSWDICRFLLWLSQFALSQVVDLATTTTLGNSSMDIKSVVMTACGWKSVKDVGTLDKVFNSMSNIGVTIQVVIAFLIAFVISLFCNVAAIWVVLSRTVNLTIQSVMAPLALSDLYGEQHFKDTRAFGWMKKYFALCIQSVVIVLAYYVTNQICSGILTGIFEKASESSATLTFGQAVNFASYVSVLKVIQIGAVIGSSHKAREVMT